MSNNNPIYLRLPVALINYISLAFIGFNVYSLIVWTQLLTALNAAALSVILVHIFPYSH